MADAAPSSGGSRRHRHHPQPQQQQQQPQHHQQAAYDDRGMKAGGHYGGGNNHQAAYDSRMSGHEKVSQRQSGENRGPATMGYGQVGAVPALAPTTGQFRSGHIEVDSLFGGQAASSMVVNSMNAPNNSTMQCGCENIDCPFCNLMTSVQMKESY